MGGGAEPVIAAPDPERAVKAPSDVLRLVVGAVLLVVVTLVGRFFGDGVAGFVADLMRGLDRLPAWLVDVVAVLSQAAAVAILAAVLVMAFRQRSARLVVAAVAAVAVAVVLVWAVTSLVDVQAAQVTRVSEIGAFGRSGQWPAAILAALTGIVAAVAPWSPRRFRRAWWAALCCVALALFACNPISFHTLLALLSGWVAGTGVTVLLGSPSHRPTPASVADGLAAVGVPLATLERIGVDARGSTPYLGEGTDGTKLFVKVLGQDERSADLLFRAFRYLQPRDLGDERPFSSLRRAVEHEALLSLTARDAGVRTPPFVAVANAEPGGFVLAYEAVAGRSLDRVDAAEVTDDILDGVWSQVAVLRHHRIAHRDLRLANVFLGDDRVLWIIDFGFSELAASDRLLTTDLAEVLASSSLLVGPERAVAAAERGVGREVAVTALERLRPAMLSGATRTGLSSDPQCLDELRRLLR